VTKSVFIALGAAIIVFSLGMFAAILKGEECAPVQEERQLYIAAQDCLWNLPREGAIWGTTADWQEDGEDYGLEWKDITIDGGLGFSKHSPPTASLWALNCTAQWTWRFDGQEQRVEMTCKPKEEAPTP
jgi:hypothetical protein